MELTEFLADEVFDRLQASNRRSAQRPKPTVDEKVAEVYKKVGVMLSRYRSGKIPKAFKILPRLKDWEYILQLTDPENWTANATYQATKIFISSLSPQLAEQFLSSILLPKIRADIFHNKKLNSHYYESLKKALYKPAAFFRGIIIPLCMDPEVTLKEATIVSSIVGKMSIPVLHSAAALLKLAEQEYSGVRSIFIKTLLDKRYALPQRVVDTMVDYFCKFADCQNQLPVLWHQSFLVFAQRYKNNIASGQRSRLSALLVEQHHDQISAEISRELEQGGNSENMQVD